MMFKRLIKIYIIFSVVMGISLHPAQVTADLAFKKKVIENCKEAQDLLTSVPQEVRRQYIEDLRLILKLKLEDISEINPEGTGPNLGTGGNSLGDFKTSDIWRTFQPLRELRAKRCVVSLLSILKPYSAEALPEIIDLSGDKTIPFDLLVSADEAIYQLAFEISKDQSLTIPDAIIQAIVDRLDTPSSYYAKNALIEIGPRIVNTLIREMQKPDPKHRELISDTLLAIDRNGSLIGSGVLLLLESPDDGLRKRAAGLLSELEDTYSFSVPALIKRVNDLSDNVEDSAIESLKIIANQSNYSGKITVTDDELDLLINKFLLTNREKRLDLMIIIQAFGPLITSYQEKLLNAYKLANDENLRGDILSLLSYSINLTPLSIKTIYDSTFHESLPIRLKAIEACNRLPNKNDTIRIFTKLLKATSQEKDTERKQWTIWQIARTIASIKPGDSGASLVPYLIQSIAINKQHLQTTLSPGLIKEQSSDGDSQKLSPIGEALISIGKSAIEPAVKALSSKDTLVRIRALQVLGRIKPSTQTARKRIIELLSDPNSEIRSAAEQSLSSLGQEVTTDIKRQLDNKNQQTRLAALRILLKSKWPINDITNSFKDILINSSCTDKNEILILMENIERSLIPIEVEKSLLSCALQSDIYSQTSLKQLARITPLSEETLLLINQAFQNPSLSKKILLSLIELTPDLGIPNKEVIPILLRELRSNDKTVQHRVFILLRNFSVDASSTLPDLLEFINKEPEDQLLLHEAITTLVSIDPAAYDYVSFFVREFKTDSYPWILKSLVKLPPEITMPVLNRSLKELPDSKKYRAVEVIGILGESVKELTAEILPYLTTQDPILHYYVTVALLKIDPTHPETRSALRVEIRRDEEMKLLREEFKSTSKPFFEAFRESTESKVERAFITKIIENLRDS